MASDSKAVFKNTQSLSVDALLSADGVPLRQYWRVLTTAGRAGEGLRAAWREQVKLLQDRIGFSYIRFHGIFHDEMMVYAPDTQAPARDRSNRPDSDNNTAYYNWTYIDDLFDFILLVGLRPFVELGFTPEAMASGPETVFAWRANITPPRDYDEWARLVEAFVRHCVERYGLEEVRRWYFEVWNEPNLGGIFWTGSQEEYFDLYRVTAAAVKGVDAGLRVGGPATSNFTTDGEAPWFSEFKQYCEAKAVPVDFYSCHPYPNTWAFDADGNQTTGYRERTALRDDLLWLKNFVARSKTRDAEIHLTEWNSSPSPRDLVHDTAFMGPFLLESILSASGLVDSLGYWVLTDLFEENGLGRGPFHGGFGLMSVHGIPKPSFHAYALLSRLGEFELGRGEGWIVTRSAGALQMLFWNYAHYTPEFASGDRSRLSNTDRYGAFEAGVALEITVDLGSARPERSHRRSVRREPLTLIEVNRDRGSAFDAWVRMGAPEHPSCDQIRALMGAAEPAVRSLDPRNGSITLTVDPHGLAFLEIPLI